MSVILHTDINMLFVHFLLKLKQVHNLKNRVFPHIIRDYMENPRSTFCKFIRQFYDIDTLCVKNLRKIGHFEICFLSIYIRALIDFS
jgi:hypothetical protein